MRAGRRETVGPADTALTGEQGVHQKYGMPA